MRNKTIICTRCPMGCTLNVAEDSGVLSVSGNSCPRGAEYGRSEFLCPVRNLTSTVLVLGGTEPLLPVRTDRPIPQAKLMEAMAALRAITVRAPVAAGQILLENIAETGANLVACADRN